MVVGQRCAHGGHHIAVAVLVGQDHSHITFDNDHLVVGADRLTGEIQSVEDFSLVKQHGLWGIKIFGDILGIQSPGAEPHHPPPAVSDRDHQPVPEAVIHAAGIPFRNQPRIQQILLAVPLGREIIRRRVPRFRGIPQAKMLNGFIRDAPVMDIRQGLYSRIRLRQIVAVKGHRVLKQRAQPLVLFLLFFLFRCERFQGDAGPVRQVFQSLLKLPALLLHNEAKNVSALITLAKAVPGLGIGKDGKSRGVYIVVKGAKTGVIFSGVAQLHLFRYQVDNIDAVFDLISNAHRLPPRNTGKVTAAKCRNDYTSVRCYS